VEFAPRHPIPMFALPNVVLFPHTALPLHIFELRYRTMVREALSHERLLTLGLFKPGWEAHDREGGVCHALGCLARIDEVEWLPNDCYDLRVLGLCRVQILRVTREFPYRMAQIEPIPQAPFSEDDPLVAIEKRALLECISRWSKAQPLPAEVIPMKPWEDDLGFEALVNAACMSVLASPEDRLELLAIDSVIDRGRRVRERLERRLRARPSLAPPPGGELN
jgi:Lon protease-like protein